MAEFVEISQQQNSVHEYDSSLIGFFHNDLLLHIIQDNEDAEDSFDVAVTQDKIALLEAAIKLKEITTNLLRQKLKLLEIKHRKIIINMKNRVEHVKKIIDEFGKFRQFQEQENFELQNYQGLGDRINKELEEDIEKIVAETQEEFFIFEKSYKESKFLVENILERAEERSKISHVPRNCQEELCVLFSVLEENLTSYSLLLVNSEEAFDEFVSLVKNDLCISFQQIDNKINLLIIGIEIAEDAYSDLIPVVFEVLMFDCATSGLH